MSHFLVRRMPLASTEDNERWRAEALQAALFRIAEVASSPLEMPDFYASLHRIVDELMFAPNLYIALYDADTDSVTFVYHVDEHDQPPPQRRMGRGITEYVIRTGEPLLLTGDALTERVAAGDFTVTGAFPVDWLGVPLKTPQRIFGMLAVQSYNPETRYGQPEQDLLMFVSRHIATALERKQAQEALRESEERYHSLVENIPIGVYRNTPGPEGRYVMANRAFLHMFGIASFEELQQITVASAYWNPAARKQFSDLLLESDTVTGVELQLRKQDGTMIWGSVTARVIHNPQTGEAEYFDCTIEDISERKRADEEVRRQARHAEALVSTAAELNAQLDLRAVLNTICTQAALVFNVSSASVSLFDAERDLLVATAADGLSAEELRQLQPVPRALYDLAIERRGPLVVVPDLHALPDVPNAPVYTGLQARTLAFATMRCEGQLVGTLNLITREVRIFSDEERALLQGLADQAALAIANARLYSALQQTNALLRAALKAKDEMIQNVSHELRTPLTHILGYVELMQIGALGRLQTEQNEALQMVHRQAHRLHNIVNQLLALQTFEPDKLEKQPINLSAWLRQTTTDWQIRAMREKISLSLELSSPPDFILGDAQFLNQMLENLLDNAFKFSPNGGPVQVRAWREGDRALIAVSDQGVGIPLTQIEQVFDRFYQVNGGVNRCFGGLGIGLALCRVIVEAHGGRIWGESAGEDQGSIFYISLPAL